MHIRLPILLAPLCSIAARVAMAQAPVVTAVTPDPFFIGTGMTCEVHGSGFNANCVVQMGGFTMPTTLVSPTRLDVDLTPIYYYLYPPTQMVWVDDWQTNLSSNHLFWTIAFLPPVLSALHPGLIVAGHGTFWLHITGHDFESDCMTYGMRCNWAGPTGTTTLGAYPGTSCDTDMYVQIPAALSSQPGNASITVFRTSDPRPSNPLTLNIGGPGSYASFDPGCQGSLGVPTLGANGPVRVGTPVTITIGAAPLAMAMLFTGWSHESFSTGVLPLSLTGVGMPGCALLVSPDFSLLALGSGGPPMLTIMVPNMPALVGIAFYQQAVVPDPQAGNAMGMVMSDGAAALIGP